MMVDALPPADDRSGLDFEALRAEGIAALQSLCGELWTDFNQHDPGVTTLEQLVYGLTDLAYRTGFEMADYLAGPDGSIDYQGLALYPPEDVLPCEALTADDYRRLFYDALPDLADIRIRPAGQGLLAVDVMAEPDAQPAALPLAQRVRTLYAAHRALGADLAEVRALRPRAYYLRGKIDTWGERSEAEVLARIVFECGEHLASGMSARRLRDVIAEGRLPEEVFDGPATRHAHVSARPDAAGAAGAAPVTISELVGVIQNIEGVRRIWELWIVDEHGQRCIAIPRDGADGSYPTMPFPHVHDDTMIEWLRLQPEHGIAYGVPEQGIDYGASERDDPPSPAWRAANRLLYEEGKLELEKLRFERRAFRSDDAHARTSYPLPAGRHRELHAYYSIQNEFPAVYGVGKFGLPDSASAERKAQARQLKGFLYPMEQLMANYLQNLQEVPTLFAPDAVGTRSYFSQVLDDAALPGIAELYGDPAQAVERQVQGAVARHDDYFERKSRVYDYLLALYGDAFPQTALRRYNHYHLADTEAWLLDAKRRLLEALVRLSAGRGRGADYGQPLHAESAVPPLAWRASILLGFEGGNRHRSLCPVWNGEPLALQEGDESLPPPPRPEWMPVPALREPAGQPLVPAALGAGGSMSEEVFRNGAALANYRLARDGAGWLLFVLAGADWQLLGQHADHASATAAAHAAVAKLASLNRECEGMHIVEHILLRPRAPQAGAAADESSFLTARISVVLPRWTLRCADRGFRNLAEECVRENCPAHLHPGFLWLSPALMVEFEGLQQAWREALLVWQGADDAAQPGHANALDAAAAALKGFLRTHLEEPA
jgi:hypothetical protein